MRIAIITSSPNKDGLTAACGAAAGKGAIMAGAEIVEINLNSFNIGSCLACNDGWGTCKSEYECQVEDDFQKVHNRLLDCDCYFFVTPVYYGDLSESAKAFLDRLRRCEAAKVKKSLPGKLIGKPWILTAAAGGGGGGTITCLLSLERFVQHIGGVIADYLPITRKSRSYKLNGITDAVASMCRYNL